MTTKHHERVTTGFGSECMLTKRKYMINGS